MKSYQKSLEELIAFTTPSAQKRNNEAIAENIFGKKESIQSLLSKIENHNLNILVDGDAGSGKSVFAIITPPPNNLKNQQAYLTLGC